MLWSDGTVFISQITMHTLKSLIDHSKYVHSHTKHALNSYLFFKFIFDHLTSYTFSLREIILNTFTRSPPPPLIISLNLWAKKDIFRVHPMSSFLLSVRFLFVFWSCFNWNYIENVFYPTTWIKFIPHHHPLSILTSLQTIMLPKTTWSPSKKLSPTMMTVAPPVVHPSLGLIALMHGVAVGYAQFQRG